MLWNMYSGIYAVEYMKWNICIELFALEYIQRNKHSEIYACGVYKVKYMLRINGQFIKQNMHKIYIK